MPDESSHRLVAIGSDHAGFKLKEKLKEEIAGMGYGVLDMGTDSDDSCDYPDFALPVAEAVSRNKAWRGVLICGSGAGMTMVANKVPGVRAATCNDSYAAEYCRLHNDANIVTMGARIINEVQAGNIARTFLETAYEGNEPDGYRHAARLYKLEQVESKYMKEQ
jgi:ribose 5-phosphate isomerase B